MQLKIDLREIVVHRIARDILNRPGLGVKVAHDVAERIVARRSEGWLRFFVAVSGEANTFKSQRQLAADADIDKVQCETFWRSLRAIHVDTPTGRKRLFRDDVELRFRHSGKVNGEFVEGGVCLHLSNQEPMTLEMNRTITATTKKSLTTLRDNYAGSARAQLASATLTPEERGALDLDTDEQSGGAHGTQLSLVAKQSA
jgi:hypothetical protein